MVKVREDLTGRRFGKLVVLEQAEDHISSSNKHYAQWKCECDCSKQIIVRGDNLRNGAKLHCGCNKDSNQTLHDGCIRDIPSRDIRENQILCQSHKFWVAIRTRCFNERIKEKYPHYRFCTLDPEWYLFSNFASWFANNYWCKTNAERIEIDKDILVKGNKVYGPQFCVVVPHSLNQLFVKRDKARGKYPIGVQKERCGNSYSAVVGNGHGQTHLGCFATPEEAFQAYKQAKEQYIKQVADEYKAKYPDFPQKLYDAMYAYEVEITD